MRNLTILRRKSFVASLAKMKVYIEDAFSPEITINDTPCRFLGELGNGEKKIFPIENGSAKLFVIAGKMSKNYCNECYVIEEGEEDIYLAGQNKYNPVNGNAFRFDGNDSLTAMTNRSRSTKKGVIIFIAAIIVGVIIGLAPTLIRLIPAKPETFVCDGITITLTNKFTMADFEEADLSFDSKDVAVFVISERFEDVPLLELYDTVEYTELLIEVNEIEAVTTIKQDKGFTYYEYDFVDPNTKENGSFRSFVFKTEDAFWVVQFGTLEENFAKYDAQIFEWAKSIEFTK